MVSRKLAKVFKSNIRWGKDTVSVTKKAKKCSHGGSTENMFLLDRLHVGIIAML